MKTLLNSIWSLVIPRIPYTEWGDRLVAYLYFVRSQKRFPVGKTLFNDVLFSIKTGPEIRHPLRVATSDKEHVKKYIKETAGDYAVETIAILREVNDVDHYDFPTRCCIKPTHASGIYIIRKSGEALPKTKIKSWLSLNYYNRTRERNYKSLRPKILIEPLVFDNENILDFKAFCYGGRAKFFQIDFDRTHNHSRRYYDTSWNALDFSINYPLSTQDVSRPACLSKMLHVCEKLSAPFTLARIDFFTNGSEFFVGEITHCPDSACGIFRPRQAERQASKLLFS